MEKRNPHKRITLRMTDEVHQLLIQAIDKSGRSMNTEINIQLLKSLNNNSKTNQDLSLESIRQIIQQELDKRLK